MLLSTSMNQSLVAARDTFSCFYIRCLVLVYELSSLAFMVNLLDVGTGMVRKALQMMDVWTEENGVKS